ncbi:MAG: methionine--tRNA ligase [Candidatus Woesearchaeota archaeon]
MEDRKPKGNKSILNKEKKILITSALPYVNNVPHLGNIIGCVLSADVFARFCRSYGCDTIYVCGTDEHGTTTEQKAIEDGVTPQEVCEKYFSIHKKIYEWFGCSFDYFGRTSSKTNHEVAQEIFLKLDKNGYIKEDDTVQMYDPKAGRHLPDRFVEGTCPKCNYESARGDQCDNCGEMLNPEDLINPRSTITGETPEARNETHIFIDLPKIKDRLKDWIDKTAREANWSQNALTMTEGWLKTGVKPRCISRNLRWGVPIPKKGYEDKVFYSWFDAPIGYIGITKEENEEWEKWWKNPENTELYQFMGKDNIPFHTIMFPAFLIGSGDNWTLLHQISSTEYLNYEDGAFSKSRGIGVFGNDAIESEIESDIWRYYLLVNRPETADTLFTWKDFQDKNNNELLANLGNFVNRTLTFIKKNHEGKIPVPELTEEDKTFLSKTEERIDTITRMLSSISLKEALKEIMLLSKSGNQYFQENRPWEHIRNGDKTRSGTIMYVCANLVRRLAILIEPYMPNKSESILSMLNLERQAWSDLGQDKDISEHEIGKPKIMFRKFEDDEIHAWKERYSGSQKARMKKEETMMEKKEGFSKLNLKVARIKEVKEHPKADKLLILKVDLGDEERQLVAGIKGHYTQEELQGRNIIMVTNLKPAKLRGEKSQGMLLAADNGKDVRLLGVCYSEPGDQVYIEGVEPGSETITIEDFAAIEIKTRDGKAIAEDKPLKTEKEEVMVDIEDNSKVR